MAANRLRKNKKTVKVISKNRKRLKKVIAHKAKHLAKNDLPSVQPIDDRPEIPPHVRKFYEEKHENEHEDLKPMFDESEFTGELPIDYDENKLVLQFADPKTAYIYWSISLQERCRLRMGFGGHLVLKLHNISYGTKDEFWFPEDINSCLLALEHPNCIYRAELGYYSTTRYNCLAISNSIEVPSDQVSEQHTERVEEPVVVYVDDVNQKDNSVNGSIQEQVKLSDNPNVEIIYSDIEPTSVDFTGYVDFMPAELKNNPSSGDLPSAVGIGKGKEKNKKIIKSESPILIKDSDLQSEKLLNVEPEYIPEDFDKNKPTSNSKRQPDFISDEELKNNTDSSALSDSKKVVQPEFIPDGFMKEKPTSSR